jgi:EpsD family peptidyl-prolyl cis-trans isomerase
MKHTISHTASRTALASTLALLLAACGGGDGKPAATQVAAKVGKEEISVHQINQVLSRTPPPADAEAAKRVSRDVLERLIDQQLAVSQAMDAELHRTPDVVAQIEAARREILARAYAQKVAAAVAKPTPEQVRKYFDDNSALFSDRRIYNVQEVIVSNQPGLAEQLRALATQQKPVDEVAAQLRAKGLSPVPGSATRAADQIPLEVLPRMHALQDGQAIVFETPQSLTYVRLMSSRKAPIEQTAALPRIEQFLTNRAAGEAVAANIKQLRQSQTVSYMGEFAQAPAQAPAAVPTQAVTPASTATPTAAPTAAPAPTTAIEKGVAGLK